MLSANPRISLIVSVYEQAWVAPYVLPSIAEQDCTVPFEILFCDDGSMDSFFGTIRNQFSSKNLDIRYIWQPKDGFRVSRSRNNAIRCATSDLLVFADGDMWLSPTFLEDHWRAHDRERLVVCGSRVDLPIKTIQETVPVDMFAKVMNDVSTMTDNSNRPRQEAWIGSRQPWMACLSANFSTTRSSELRFDEEFKGWGSEDRDLAFRLYKQNYSIRLLSRPNAVHIVDVSKPRFASESDVVAFLKGKLLLARKYPDGDMEASLDLVRWCHRDPHDDKWYIGRFRSDMSASTILDEFKCWCEERDVQSPGSVT